MSKCARVVTAMLLAASVEGQARFDDGRTLRLHDISGIAAPPSRGELGDAEWRARLRSWRVGLGEARDHLRQFLKPRLEDPAMLEVLASEAGPRVVLLGTPSQHRAVEEIVARNAAKTAVQCDLRLLDADAGAVAEILGKRLETAAAGGEGVPAPWRALVLAPGPETDALVKRLTSDERVGLLQAPRLVALPLLPWTMTIGEEVHLLRDVRAEGVVPRATIAVPRIETVQDGLRLTGVVGFVGAKTIGARLEVSWTRLPPELQTQEVDMAGQKFVVATSGAETVTLRAHVQLPLGGTAVLVAAPRDGKQAVLLLYAT